MTTSETLKLILVLTFTLLCLFQSVDAVVTDNMCTNCEDGVTSEHCTRCKRYCTPLMNGCYYKRDGPSTIQDNQRFPKPMFDRMSQNVKTKGEHSSLDKRSFRSAQPRTTTERCSVENLITTLPDNWQKDILEVVRWAILAKKAGSLPLESADLAAYLLNYIKLEESRF